MPPKNSKRTIDNTDISPNKPDRKKHSPSMDELLTKLSTTVDTLSSEVTSLRLSNENLTKQVADLNSNVSDWKTKYDESQQNFDTKCELLEKCESRLERSEQDNMLLKSLVVDLQEKLTELEYHQKRNNLVFDGFIEVPHETDTDVYHKLCDCLGKLMDVSNLRIARCHRLGPYKAGAN